MKPKNITKILFCMAIFLGLTFPLPVTALEGFRVRIDYLDNSKFPQVDAFVSVSDANGLPIKNLTQDAFTLTENGSLVSPESFEAIQNKEQPLSITLVMDTSGSMRGQGASAPMQKAIEAAVSFVGQLSPADRVAVIKFSDQAEEIQILTEDKTLVTQAIQSLRPEGQYTALYDAIIKGHNLLKSQSGRRIIVLITDGKDTGSGLFKSEDVMQELSTVSIPIYPMGFGNVNGNELKKMAELTGGSAKILPSVSELSQSFDEILSSLREQYKIRYVSSFPADDKKHDLLAMVNYGGGQEKAEYSFIAKSSSISVTLPDLQPSQTVGGLVKFSPVIDWIPTLIKNVEISMDGTPIQTTTTSGEFIYEWNSFTAPTGMHDFLIKVEDISGNMGQVSISLNVQPPIIMDIISPQNGGSLSGTAQIKAKVTALNGIEISKVVFFVDNQEVATVPGNPAKTEYTAEWKTREARQYPIKVIAYDMAGLFTTETGPILVNVEPGDLSGLIVIIVLAFAALIIPLALRWRKRKRTAVGGVIGAPIGKLVLYELEGMNPNRVWSLDFSEVKLGRKREENDIHLKGLKASRHHAVIRFEQGQYFIYSLNTDNLVTINDAPVVQKRALVRGDIIRLGETVLRFDS
jgi:VWFA-related protein